MHFEHVPALLFGIFLGFMHVVVAICSVINNRNILLKLVISFILFYFINFYFILFLFL